MLWDYRMLFTRTNLVSQHAFEPLLPGHGDVDGESWSAVHYSHGGSGEQVISQVHHYLHKHTFTHCFTVPHYILNPSNQLSVYVMINDLMFRSSASLCLTYLSHTSFLLHVLLNVGPDSALGQQASSGGLLKLLIISVLVQSQIHDAHCLGERH